MAARRRRSRATGLVVLLVVAALAVVGLYLGDRYAEDRVERDEASQLQTDLGTSAAPVVDVEGWPFLTQVAARRVDRVHVVADDLVGGGSPVPVEHLDLVLTDVTTRDWYQTLEAAYAEGTAQLDYDALTTLTKVPLTSAGGGRVQLERRTSLFGTDVVARVTGTPLLDVEAQTVTLADPEMRVGDVQLPAATAEALLRTVVQPIPLTGLPLGLRIGGLEATETGVVAQVTGTAVVLRRG